MFAKYVCLGCGICWRSRDIIVICPVCRSKAVLIKNIKVGEEIDRGRIQKNNLGVTKRL